MQQKCVVCVCVCGSLQHTHAQVRSDTGLLGPDFVS